jgi:hypothetical protein
VKIGDVQKEMTKEQIRIALSETAPQATKACETDGDVVIFCQEAFGTSVEEILILGLMVKYAGLCGKEVNVIELIESNDKSGEDTTDAG